MSAIEETTNNVFGATLTRRKFVKGSGAMIVGFSLVGAGLGAKTAKGAVGGTTLDPALPSSWLEIRADNPLRAVAVLKQEMEPWRVSLFGDRLHVIVDGDAQAAARELTARLAREGIRVSEVRDDDYTLEDVFLAIVEKGAVAA